MEQLWDGQSSVELMHHWQEIAINSVDLAFQIKSYNALWSHSQDVLYVKSIAGCV